MTTTLARLVSALTATADRNESASRTHAQAIIGRAASEDAFQSSVLALSPIASLREQYLSAIRSHTTHTSEQAWHILTSTNETLWVSIRHEEDNSREHARRSIDMTLNIAERGEEHDECAGAHVEIASALRAVALSLSE